MITKKDVLEVIDSLCEKALEPFVEIKKKAQEENNSEVLEFINGVIGDMEYLNGIVKSLITKAINDAEKGVIDSRTVLDTIVYMVVTQALNFYKWAFITNNEFKTAKHLQEIVQARLEKILAKK